MTFNSKKNSHILKMRDLNLPKYCNLDALVTNNNSTYKLIGSSDSRLVFLKLIIELYILEKLFI